MTGNIESDNDDQWLDDEIRKQLDQIDDSSIVIDGVSDDEQYSLEETASNNCIYSPDTQVQN